MLSYRESKFGWMELNEYVPCWFLEVKRNNRVEMEDKTVSSTGFDRRFMISDKASFSSIISAFAGSRDKKIQHMSQRSCLTLFM